MKFLATVLMAFSFYASATYANSVSGHVSDRFGQPLGGMSVCVQGPLNVPVYPAVHCTYTTPYGFYGIGGLFAGTYNVSVQGYGIYYTNFAFIQFNTVLNFVF